MRQLPIQKETPTEVPEVSHSPQKRELKVSKKEKELSPFAYFRTLVGKKININQEKQRWLEIKSARKNSGVKVVFGVGEKTLSEETVKESDQVERLKRLTEWGTVEPSVDDVEKVTEELPAPARKRRRRKKTIPEAMPDTEPTISEQPIIPETQDKQLVPTEVAPKNEGIDPEKRKEGVKEQWIEKVRNAASISELCDIIDQIGFTEVNGETVHPEAMKVRLEILDSFSAEGLIKWKLEEITREFEIRDRAEEIKLGKSEKTVPVDAETAPETVLEFKRQEKPKESAVRTEELDQLKKAMEDAKAEYEKKREMREEEKKELTRYFRKEITFNEDEMEYYRKRYEEAEKRYKEAA